MNKKNQVVTKYIAFDIIGTAIAWLTFHAYRKEFVESELFGEHIQFSIDTNIILGLIFITCFWSTLFFISGFYRDVLRRSRLKEFGLSVAITLAGVTIIFFTLLLDDYVATYRNYYQLFLVLLALQFVLTYFPRLHTTSSTTRKIRNGDISFPTLIVGDGEEAIQLVIEINNQKKSQGNKIIGFISTNQTVNPEMEKIAPRLGDYRMIKQVVAEHKVEEVILAIDHMEGRMLSTVVNDLLGLNTIVKAIPSMYDYLTGRVKMSSIFGTPLIQISFNLMPNWQQTIKVLIDRVSSLMALTVLLPVIGVIAIAIKATSKGPIFFIQERIGQYGKPFNIYKFRSMYVDAEANGPALSSKIDNRITPLGRFLRKTRFDELPNFLNVLKGDMSLVGPRPERQFFIDKIIERAPHYVHLQKVKPGITSWGQVKYGYAENVEQMTERLKYDLLYIENMTLYVDFKIIIYTLITVFKGRGI